MKVCQICAVDLTLKTFILPLIDANLASGNDVISICTKGKFTEEMIKDGYKIKSIPISRSFNIFAHLISTIRVYKFLKKEKFDVVHVHTPVAAMVGRLAAFFARSPIVIYTAHGFYFHDDMNFTKKHFFIFLEFCFGLITDILFTQSSEDAQSAINYKIAPKENVHAIGNGVDIKNFNPQIIDSKYHRSLLEIPKDAFVIGMISRLVKEKGIKEFLEAAIEINKNNKNCYFLLIGEREIHDDHSEGVEFDLLNAKNIMKKNIILTGYRTDIPELLSVMKLAPSMNKFINNPEWTRHLGITGRQRALEHYDERKVVDLQIEIIRKFVGDADIKL